MKTKTTICTLALMTIASVASAETMLEEKLSAEVAPGTAAIFACQVGERIAIDAHGIKRVSTDSSKILKVATNDSGDTLYITCDDLGTTYLTVHRKDRVESVVVRAGAAHDRNIDMRQCGDIRGAKARVVLDRAGRVDQVLVSGMTEERSTCIRETLHEVSWTEGESFLRVARLEW